MTTTAQQPVPAPVPASQRRKHPVLRWVLRMLLGIVILLLILAIVVQIVLWTSAPKSIIVGKVEEGFGLRMGVSAVSTSWLGHTSLSGVRLALPLSQHGQSFIDVPSMKVSHTNLLALLLGWNVQMKSIELSKPIVRVRQDSSGQWNVQEVAELLARLGGKKTGQETAQTSPTPSLPWIKISDATLDIEDNQHRALKVEPIDVDGEPDTPVSWKYDVEVRSHLSLLGRLAPGGTWAHEATLQLSDLAPWVRPWDPSFNQTTAFDGAWSGEFNASGFRGFLKITGSRFGGYAADGALRISRADGLVTVSPDKLHLQTPQAMLGDVRIPTGQVTYDGKGVRATRLLVNAWNGPISIDGWYQPATQQGAMQAGWQDLIVPKIGVKHAGNLDLSYSHPPAAPMTVSGKLKVNGSAPQGPFEALVQFGAQGNTARDLSWQLTAPKLEWKRAEPLVLDGLGASGSYSDDNKQKLLQLSRLALPSDNRLAGDGFYDLSSSRWKISLNGSDLPLHLIDGTRLSFGIGATGQQVPSRRDPKKEVPLIELDEFFLSSGEARLSLNGTYDGREPKPVKANGTFINTPGPEARLGQPSIVHGNLTGRINLDGTVSPRHIDIKGTLEGHDAMILGHPLGEISAGLAGAIDDQKAELHADGVPFLGGVWDLGGTYVLERDGKQVHATELALAVSNLPLPNVTDFLKLPRIDGTFGGQWYVYYPGLKPHPEKIRVTGGASIRNFSASLVHADEVTFTTSLKDGIVAVNPFRARIGNYGRIDARARMSVNQWRQLHAAVTFTAFPIAIPQASVVVQLYGGTNRIDVFLPDASSKIETDHRLRVNADLSLRASLALREQREGELRIRAGMQGRIVNLQSLRGDLLGGRLAGSGVTDIDHWATSRAQLEWQGLQADRVVRLYPRTRGVGGTFSGSAVLQPATVPRPLEPLQLDLVSSPRGAHWRAVQLGEAQVHAFVSGQRIIAADKAKSTIRLGEGDVDFWFSSSTHTDYSPTPSGREVPTDQTISNQLTLTLHKVNIDPFVKSFEPSHTPGFGNVSGQLFLLAAPKTTSLLRAAQTVTSVAATQPATGPAGPMPPVVAEQQDLMQRFLSTTTIDGALRISNSDLGNFTPIAFLYNAMRLGGDIRRPTGRGSVSVHMEQGKMHIPNLYYFNRGIEVRGVATLDQMWDLPDNPIRGNVVGTARPLKYIKFPLFAEADAVLSALQGSLSGVGFGGTLRNPGYFQLLALKQLGSDLRGLILGEIAPE